MINLKFWAVVAILISMVAALQLEVNNLNAKLENLRAQDAAAAAAVTKLEHDLLGTLKAAENTKQAQQALQDAARRKNIDQGLKGLPSGDFRSPVYWNGTPPKENQ